jgi:hypothetical protein
MSERSLYKDRAPIAAAIRLKEAEIFAHRRDFAIGGGPAALSDPARPYNPRTDLTVLQADRSEGPGGSLHWRIVLQNRSRVVAYRDPLYATTYLDERGTVVDERHERIKLIFQPGTAQTIDLNDGYAGPPFATARLEIIAGEALLPVP